MKERLHKFVFLFFVLILSSFIFFLSSCRKSTEPIYNPQTLQLTVADVSCTEAWLKLKAQIAQKDSSDLKLQLYRNDSQIVSKPFTSTDSLLYVYGLQPATSYAFTAKVLNGAKLLAVSAKVEATTMDTTSHNFTWQTFEFGGVNGSSYFKDVAIIDENDIWAVGEIYTENDKYNAAHWNGQKWELKKITYGGWFWTINTVIAFSHNDVWFSAIIKWNGSRFVEYPVPNVLTGYGLNKIWGTSDHDLYVVGKKGLIAHYDGKQWQRIESGTDLNFYSIWGEGKNIFCIATKKFTEVNPQIFRIKNLKAYEYQWPYSYLQLPYALWFGKKKIYVCGSKVFTVEFSNSQLKIKTEYQPVSFLNTIKGDGYNNIFTAGAYGYIYHFNGITWKTVTNRSAKDFFNMDVKNNMVVLVGLDKNSALIQMARINKTM